jgi:hypothetical protein
MWPCKIWSDRNWSFGPASVKEIILTYLLAYGAEPFLRSRQLCSPSRTSEHFMEPEVSIAYSQEPSNWILSWAISIQSTPSHPIYLRSILILHIHLRLGLPSGLFPSGVPTNIPSSYTKILIPITCITSIRRTSEHGLGTFTTGDTFSWPPSSFFSLYRHGTILAL